MAVAREAAFRHVQSDANTLAEGLANSAVCLFLGYNGIVVIRYNCKIR